MKILAALLSLVILVAGLGLPVAGAVFVILRQHPPAWVSVATVVMVPALMGWVCGAYVGSESK